MKRILVTGFTNRMVGSKNIRRDYITFSTILQDLLRKYPEVKCDVKKTKIGEDLSMYDKIFLGVAPISSITSGNVVECCDIVNNNNNIVMYLDDWSVANIKDDWINRLQGGSYFKWRKCEEYKDVIANGLGDMLDGSYPILAPMFGWGSHKLFGDTHLDRRIVPFDPSIFVHDNPFYSIYFKNESHEKSKQWILASLGNHERWLKNFYFNWNMLKVGCKSLEQPILNEDEVMKLYYDSYGVLCPEYNSSGTGWWRARYNFAVLCHNIILTSNNDANAINKHFQIEYREIERKPELQLQNVIKRQSEMLVSQYEPKEILKSKLDDLMS